MKRLPAILLIIGWAASSGPLYAQVESTQYFMNSLPQFVTNNPAFVPKYKFALGLPGSSIGMTYTNNGFKYNDLVRRESGKVIADLPNWSKNLPDKTWITATVQTDLFRLGLRINPSIYLSFNSTVKGNSYTLIPKDLASILVNGNAPYIGRTANLSPEFHLISYWENAAAISASVMKDLTVGARFKVIKGLVSAQTDVSDFSISVAENYQITAAADMNVKTSGFQSFESGFSLANYRNSGWGVDLGATYKLMNKLTVAASLVDIGRITWKSDLKEYILDKATASYTFTGIDIEKAMNGDTDYAGAQLDSLVERFTPVEKVGASFYSPLPGKIYLSGEYELLRNLTVGSVLFAEKYKGRFSTGWSLGMNKNFGKVLSTSLSYTISNRSFNNLGAGVSFNFAPVQIYVVGDNLLRLPFSVASSGKLNNYINSTQVFTFRAGLNFVWGWIKDPAQEEDRSRSFNAGKRKSSGKTKNAVEPDYLKVRRKKK